MLQLYIGEIYCATRHLFMWLNRAV